MFVTTSSNGRQTYSFSSPSGLALASVCNIPKITTGTSSDLPRLYVNSPLCVDNGYFQFVSNVRAGTCSFSTKSVESVTFLFLIPIGCFRFIDRYHLEKFIEVFLFIFISQRFDLQVGSILRPSVPLLSGQQH